MSSFLFTSCYNVMVCYGQFLVLMIEQDVLKRRQKHCSRKVSRAKMLEERSSFTLFFPREIFTGINFKLSFTCFCYYFYGISFLGFWFDLRIYCKAQKVFGTPEVVSFLAKFIVGGLEISRE